VSAWLTRARTTVADYETHCGGHCEGHDMLSGDERSLINRAMRIVDQLEQIEQVAAIISGDLAGSSASARLLYFRTADLRFLLRVIKQRRAKAAAA
jgi:hypothetical protein